MKLVSSGMLLGVILIGVLLVANYFFNDILGIGYNRLSVMATENRILKEQVQSLTSKISGVEKAIDNLSDRGNELRLMVDLTKLDDDTRQAAIGGSVAPQANAFLTGEAAQIISTSQSLIDRLSREIRLQQTSYEEIAKRMEYNKDFFAHIPAIKPMGGYYSINGFGMRMHPVLHVYRMHDGIDIVNDVGTPVYAAGDGIVHFAGRTAGGYGVVIEIQHGYGYSTLYAHLSQVLVRAGQRVNRGELIAKSGRSGLVSGPHLHYEVRRSGRKLNPVDFFFDDVEAARYRAALAAAQDQHHG
ncbi:MAG: peptidoglycan DD-metalloendopeptidase family protein [Bacteroidota bacterium]